ncbi:hypothetical protein C488_11248 [Natrinema pellirubrum DSM 15624]|uniref:Uncharacterized protein n=1 Tax=Natrinema pellirubrum (strain DSM 15624 / CIP 106293 / JCM 10476 / NCIMB 786 / 157) TaxID=797303 RepID=L0JL39_NATP1|nr:hypothetical protein [Natrinema pellirubrum]AGB32245.1 hypothetical protein Natpe_2429 [Natrinema pellirubrum DSM 15624]ELY75023.1 hypothetical protein C488_11248 [Natrinema pellirubrum DSM 15624]
MSLHGDRSQGARDRRGRELIAHLFDVDTGRIESLSWSLGNRVTVEADAERLFALDHRRSARTVTAFSVTDYTCVVRLRSPVGREKFYGVADADLPTEPAGPEWGRTD